MQSRTNQATGFRSDAVTSQPNRIASRGIAPPPANGSRMRGARPPNASRISSRSFSISGSLSRPQWSTPPAVSSRSFPARVCLRRTSPPIRASKRLRPSASPGSGNNVASSTARQAAKGLLAGQM